MDDDCILINKVLPYKNIATKTYYYATFYWFILMIFYYERFT